MKKLLEFLYGVSQQESEIDNMLDEDFTKLLEQADAEEVKSLAADKSPLSAALKSVGINGASLKEDPEGFAMVTDDRDEYIAAINILGDPETMHALAVKGWVASKCGDIAMTGEAPEYKLRFLEISTVETSDSDTAEGESEIIKKGREFATKEPEHDSENPVDHKAPEGNDLKKVKIGEPSDGKQPEGKIKDSLSATDLAANLLEGNLTEGSKAKLTKPASGGKVAHAFKTKKKKK